LPWVAAGDFNQDGKTDLIFSSGASGGSVNICLGNGDGTFGPANTFKTGSFEPQSVVIADFNGDGRLDVAVADFDQFSVSMFAGNGDGTLQPRVFFKNDASEVFAVAAADFNGDSKPDIATIGCNSPGGSVCNPASGSTLSIYFNTTQFPAVSDGCRMPGCNPSRSNKVDVSGPITTPGITKIIGGTPLTLTATSGTGDIMLMGGGGVAVYSANGTPKWSQTVQFIAANNFAISADGRTFYLGFLGTLSALQMSNGSPIWPAPFQSPSGEGGVGPLALGPDGTVFFLAGGGQVNLHSLTPGEFLNWTAIPNTTLGGPIFDSTVQTAYFFNTKNTPGGPIGNIESFSTQTGAFITNTPCDPRGQLFSFAPWDTIYSDNGSGNLQELSADLQSCSVISNTGDTAGIVGFIDLDIILIRHSTGIVTGVRRTGAILWETTFPLLGGQVDHNGNVYGADGSNGDAIALVGTSGQELWRTHFGTGAGGLLLNGDGCLIFQSGTDIFRGCTAATGTINVTTNISTATFTIAGPVTYLGNGTSFTQPNALPGVYNVTFGVIPGYITPTGTSQTLQPGGTIAFNGIYQLATPIIAAIDPVASPAGSTITLSGSNFGSIQGNSSLSFGIMPAIPLSWNDTQIVTAVPSTLAPNKTYDISVTTLAATSNIVPFTVSPKDIVSGLTFPISDSQNYTPYTVPISSILDHDRRLNILVAYSGERGRRVDGSVSSTQLSGAVLDGFSGYQDAQTPQPGFLVNSQYDGAVKLQYPFLFYELTNSKTKFTYQHPGYDYRTTGNVLSPASGKLYIIGATPSGPKSDPINGYNGTTSAWCGFHTFKILRADGGESWFLHIERFLNKGENGAAQDLDKMARNALGGDNFYNCAKDHNLTTAAIYVADVSTGEPIAIIGRTGTPGIHLHHEERNGAICNSDGSNCLVDPFGWEGATADPLTSNPGTIMWRGYIRPVILTASVDSSSNTLHVHGSGLVLEGQKSSVEIWKPVDLVLSKGNSNDGTRVFVIPEASISSISAGDIVATIPAEITRQAGSLTVKIAFRNGPRSVAVPIKLDK
jgi:hypothetical protein